MDGPRVDQFLGQNLLPAEVSIKSQIDSEKTLNRARCWRIRNGKWRRENVRVAFLDWLATSSRDGLRLYSYNTIQTK